MAGLAEDVAVTDLDDTTVADAIRSPEAFRTAQGLRHPARHGSIDIGFEALCRRAAGPVTFEVSEDLEGLGRSGVSHEFVRPFTASSPWRAKPPCSPARAAASATRWGWPWRKAGASVAIHALPTMDKLADLHQQIRPAAARSLPLTPPTPSDLAGRPAGGLHGGRLRLTRHRHQLRGREPAQTHLAGDGGGLGVHHGRQLAQPVLHQPSRPRIMRRQGGGKIVHIGSINSHFAVGSVSVYGAAKGGVAQLTKVMAVEWAKDHIQANCLIPGFVYTPLSRSDLGGRVQGQLAAPAHPHAAAGPTRGDGRPGPLPGHRRPLSPPT